MFYILPVILLIITLVIFGISKSNRNKFLLKAFIISIISIILTSLIVYCDYNFQTIDTEVWSGQITDIQHIEEWDEWHEGYYETYTDSNGKSQSRWIDGYWEHHYAENKIKTSDNGWINVNKSPDGRKFTDNWVNSTQELYQFWKIGDPTASSHTYENKVQASYSIYKHKNINLKQYSNLPKYPKDIHDYIYIDRFLGEIPNKIEVLKCLNKWNTELNKFIPDPEKQGKMRSWKQVNIIFVNLGNVSSDYGFALQYYWGGGNKNDFVISFGIDESNSITWVYPFSWADSNSSELLKLETKDYILGQKTITNWIPIIEKISNLVAEKFERKQFADFSYLQIEIRNGAIIIIWIMNIILCFVGIYTIKYYY